MRIIIDAMGGDNAPAEIVEGAVLAAEIYGSAAIETESGDFIPSPSNIDITLVGDVEQIRSAAAERGLNLDRRNIELIHADQVITMEDPALSVIREKNASSMSVGLHMLAEGKGDAFISAGNTGALHAGSSLIVRRIKGIQRSAIATILPFEKPMLLIDSGANTEVLPSHLYQFGMMGALYMKAIFGIENPAVGLLNNGSERTKGTQKMVETYNILEAAADINFVGNIEGKDVPTGKCDVLVTDGFTGNVLLKTCEGLASFLFHKLKGTFYKNTMTKLAALSLKKGLMQLKTEFDSSEYGGAPLLGLSKPVIKAHGSSDARAIKNAVHQAISFVDTGIIADIAQRLQQDAENKQTETAAAPAENTETAK